VNGVRSKTSKNKIALFQPLTLLELVVYHRENADILRIKEVKCLHPYQTIYQDVRKSTIAIFINEILNKAVKDQIHAEEIGEFLIRSMIALDELSSGENFHLVFLFKLSHYLCFGPASRLEVLGNRIISEAEGDIVSNLIRAEYDTQMSIKYEERKNILDALIWFYKSHIDSLGEIRSLEVLKEVLS